MNNAIVNMLVPVETLPFRPWEGQIPPEGQVEIADIDWFTPLKAKVYRYPEGHVTESHTISKNVLLVILKGEVLFEQHGSIQVAGPGTFHTGGKTPWRTTIVAETYFLVVEEGDAEMEFSK